ncbi:hypothetical protein BC936DRAFT_138841 [Jimgerdemannia flammicorona]|uniref:Uncharacterized protein n=1 Tax=Jimgerdemannia flammicorona TaxID=994334 RepID=A0A433DI96_9FUNG|nr:hypothetical protein BC936DRAFT_138841 [Jimgerdemannia flammicorona]
MSAHQSTELFAALQKALTQTHNVFTDHEQRLQTLEAERSQTAAEDLGGARILKNIAMTKTIKNEILKGSFMQLVNKTQDLQRELDDKVARVDVLERELSAKSVDIESERSVSKAEIGRLRGVEERLGGIIQVKTKEADQLRQEGVEREEMRIATIAEFTEKIKNMNRFFMGGVENEDAETESVKASMEEISEIVSGDETGDVDASEEAVTFGWSAALADFTKRSEALEESIVGMVAEFSHREAEVERKNALIKQLRAVNQAWMRDAAKKEGQHQAAMATSARKIRVLQASVAKLTAEVKQLSTSKNFTRIRSLEDTVSRKNAEIESLKAEAAQL